MDDNVTPNDEENVEDVATEEVEQPESTEEPEEKQEETQEEAPEETEEAEDTPQQVPVPSAGAPRMNIGDVVGEDGTVDLQKLQSWADGVADYADQRASRTIDTKLEESQQWERVYTKYPDWKNDKAMRDLIHKQRIGTIYAGGKNDLVKEADKIAKLTGQAESQGKQKAQTSITRQKAATLETASKATDSSGSDRQALLNQVGSRNRQTAEAARQALLKDMLAKGEV